MAKTQMSDQILNDLIIKHYGASAVQIFSGIHRAFAKEVLETQMSLQRNALEDSNESEKDEAPNQKEGTQLLECDIKPRPLSHPLKDYHLAMSEGPLHSEWKDKPHRLVYDLIAAVQHYAGIKIQEKS